MNTMMMPIFQLIGFISVLVPLAALIFAVFIGVKILNFMKSHQKSMMNLQSELEEIKTILKEKKD